MTASALCPKCGGPISATAPEGLCPRCLLRSVFRKPPPLRPAKGPPPIPGTPIHVGDYELLQEVGRGGMGVVYRARQSKLNRLVALKLMLGGHLAGDRAKQRVRNEAQAAARLQHPNIVAVYDVGEHEGAPFIAMEYVEGATLDSVARARPLKPKDAAELVRPIAQAIHYAHQQSVVHRDLKPSNIIIDASGRPRITDFGLAKHLESDAALTLSGQAIGTPSFMSPEQAGGKRTQIGPATDIYSLGGILYFLLSGRPPFVADTRDEVISQVLRADPVPPRRLNASTPRDLQNICLKCLDKNPNHRYRTAEELADDLGRYLRNEPIRAKAAHPGTKIWRWCQRQPVAASLLAGLLLISVLAVFFFLAAVGGVVVSLQRAEQNAKEQKRLRDIAEAALHNLDTTSTPSYRTSGVFRLKLPPGVMPVTGDEKLAVLNRAFAHNQTIQQAQFPSEASAEPLHEMMVSGAAELSKKSGLADPALAANIHLLGAYQSSSLDLIVWVAEATEPQPVDNLDTEKSFKERLAWLLANEGAGAKGRVESQLTICGRPAVMVEVEFNIAGLQRFWRCYYVYLQELPTHRYFLNVVWAPPTHTSSVADELINSATIFLPEGTK